MKFPFADLAAAMGVTEAHACRLLGLNGSTAQDYRKNGMSVRVADRLAVKAGFHPAVVWPAWMDLSIEELECRRRRWRTAKARQRNAA